MVVVGLLVEIVVIDADEVAFDVVLLLVVGLVVVIVVVDLVVVLVEVVDNVSLTSTACATSALKKNRLFIFLTP